MESKKLGTFGGVFTPSLLTILGVIMYLRFGWVVGNVGLMGTMLIVSLSTMITFLTSLSIASIATNTQVKAGGAYYMISRSLGVEIGGALGIPLYLAQTLSVALYVMGFSESMVAIFPFLNIKAVGLVTTMVLGGLAFYSTQAAIRAQYVILAVIGLSILSLLGGKPLDSTDVEMAGIAASDSVGFWQVFAVFFPAVTGIMAGVNMSGDLKNPSKSIPYGTFLAVGTGYFIYMLLPIVLSSRADVASLVSDPLIMMRISFWGGAIVLGIWGASLSSAVGSLLGAPRVLQALTRDNVVPRRFSFLSKGYGQENIPKGSTILTIAITLVCVIAGDLNTIAPILTMFFLATYGILNVTAGIERFLKSPSFRPKFKVHWGFSLIGALGCVAVMFLIHAVATVLAVVFILIVLGWLRRRRLKTTWGDVRNGMLLQVVRFVMLRLTSMEDPRSWRPNILVFSGAPVKRWHLIDFANGLAQEKGLFTVATILPEKGVSQEKIYQYEKQIREYLLEKNIRSLVRVMRAENPFIGARHLSNAYGLGSVVPNTILLGDTTDESHHEAYAEMISHFYKSRKNVIILRDENPMTGRQVLKVDLWWGGLKGNGGLMMVLAYMMQNSPHWQQVSVTIKMVVASRKAAAEAEKNLENLLSSIRVEFDRKILVGAKDEIFSLLTSDSMDADLVMLGLKSPDDTFESYYNDLKTKTAAIPRRLFVVASHDIAFKEILS
ncbi:Na-K-Cl cotransporter [Thermophagus sp. OGC60D27]|uniref:Na-K-Cl cotransporter n=1 Tax=Thermophagus sp. OGC60D27 TaxID=3458415 RepID=UPI004037C0B8